MVPYSVNVRVRKMMIYCVVINKNMEMSYLEKNVKQIIDCKGTASDKIM